MALSHVVGLYCATARLQVGYTLYTTTSASSPTEALYNLLRGVGLYRCEGQAYKPATSMTSANGGYSIYPRPVFPLQPLYSQQAFLM